MTNVCTIASTDLYFEIYDLWMVFAKTELGDPGSALPALQLMPPCTSEKKQNLRLSIQSAAHTRNTTTTHLFRRTVIYYMANIDPSLSLCQLTLCQCTMRKVSTIFTWTTKRNVCCDKTKKIEMDLHVGHPFTINTEIIILGCMYLFLNKHEVLFQKFEYCVTSNNYSFFLYNPVLEVKNRVQK